MADTFHCPTCSAPLEYSGSGSLVRCPYCNNSVIVPEELRSKKSASHPEASAPGQTFISAEKMENISQLLRAGQKIEAIKIYRQATNLGLKEAKDAIDAMEISDPVLRAKPPTKTAQSRLIAIAIGLFFLAIASIFPIVFIPISIESWQAQQYAGAVLSFLGAVIWAVVWGGIGVIGLFAK
jgi:DNA-directed RNA polymerase subunit RPC12/RpoP